MIKQHITNIFSKPALTRMITLRGNKRAKLEYVGNAQHHGLNQSLMSAINVVEDVKHIAIHRERHVGEASVCQRNWIQQCPTFTAYVCPLNSRQQQTFKQRAILQITCARRSQTYTFKSLITNAKSQHCLYIAYTTLIYPREDELAA